jgi:hypothetical protein
MTITPWLITVSRGNKGASAGKLGTSRLSWGICAAILAAALVVENNATAKERSPTIPRFCVARDDVDLERVDKAIEWACTAGGISNPACKEPAKCDVPVDMSTYDRADIIFSLYYKKHQKTQQDGACNFGGTAQLSTGEPNKYYNFTTNVLTPCP